MLWEPSQILHILDTGCARYTFPMLDNGYVYLAATRLSLFRSEEDWAIVLEVFGFSPRSGLPDTHIHTFASKLYNRDRAKNYDSQVAYQSYLSNNPYNDSRFVHPVEDGPWIDADSEDVAESGEVIVRGRSVRLPPTNEYAGHGIELSRERPAVFEFCRYLADIARDEVLASPTERRISVLPEMRQILQLDHWHHPDVVSEEMPSEVESFRQLAQVLITGDVAFYKPNQQPNTHWSNWPEGGTL